MLTVYLPTPPSVNHCYTTLRNGRRVLKAPGREFLDAVNERCIWAAATQDWADDGGKMALWLTICWPTRQRRDLDNAAKLLQDGISRALGFDDSQIDLLIVERGPVTKDRPHVLARLAPAGYLAVTTLDEVSILLGEGDA